MATKLLECLVVGGTGATGQHLVAQLLERGHRVRVIVRAPQKLPEAVRSHENLTVITASVSDISDKELAQHVRGCDAIASCLGHTMSWRGMFGHPRRLVANTANRLCQAVRAERGNNPAHPVRFVLMNSTGCRNRDVPERISLAQRIVIQTIRALLPPHADNEEAAAFFRVEIGKRDPAVEWVVVRPDTLVNERDVTPYEIHASPIRSAIFNPGKTSRINVAHWMATLLTDSDAWSQWAGQMPVIYNTEDQ